MSDTPEVSDAPETSAPPPARRRAGTVLTIAVIVAFSAVVLMIAFLKKPAEKDLTVPEREHPVRVAVVSPEPARDPLEIPARIEPRYDAVLAAEKPGRIEEITVERGDRVAAGAVLVRLDARAWEARRRQAEVERDIAARELARWTELKAVGAVSGSDFDAVRARAERAEAALADAAAMAAQCVVRAPAAGIVSDRLAEPGEYANEGMALLRLTDLSTIKVVADVPEREISARAPGDELEFTVDRYAGEVFRARIVFVSPTARRETLTFRIEARAPNPDERLQGGMIARLRWPRRAVAGWLAVPLPAVIPRRGEHIVFVAGDDGRAVRREVTLEYVAGDRAVISAGLAPGERLIVDGQRALADGAKVLVLNDESPAAAAP